MPFTLTNPLLLAGLATIVIPVLIHLIIREERSGLAFPSLMFIRRVPFEARQPRTLRDRALLAIRCLAIVLLVLAFTDPKPVQEPEHAPVLDWSKDNVLLIDRSYSMSPPGRWHTAVDTAMQRVDRMATGERMAIVTFDDEASLITPLLADRNLLRAHLNRLEAGSGGTQLGAAFDLAMRLLRESPANGQKILLISDLQQSALEKIDRLILDRHIALEILRIDAAVERNAAVISTTLLQTGNGGHALNIRIHNTGTAPLEDVDLAIEIEGRMIEQRRISLMPQEEQTLLVPVLPALDRAVAGRVVLGPDQIAADNEHHLVMMPDAPIELVLLLSSGSSGTEPALFIEEAVRLFDNPPIRTTRMTVDAYPSGSVRPADVVILETAAPMSDTLIENLENFVEGGGSLLVLMGDLPEDTQRKPTTGDVDGLGFPLGIGGLRRITGSGAGILLPPDLGIHALWRHAGKDIADALANTRVRKVRDFNIEQAAHPSRVLAHLSHGEPWLIEQTPGKGRLLIMTTGLSSFWGNLAIETGFVPLLHETIRYLGRRTPTALSYTLGEVIDLGGQAANLPGGSNWDEYLGKGGSIIMELPEGGQQQLAAGERLYRASLSGLYQVHRADGRPPSLMFAVNPGAGESLLASASPEAMEDRILRRPAPKPVAATVEDANASDTSPPLGWYLLGFATLVLWLEAQLANRLSRRRLAGVSPVAGAEA